MRTARDGSLAFYITLGWLLAACSGGQTGDLGGHNGGSEVSGNCDEDEQPLENLTTQTELGFTASDLLERLQGTRESSLAWGTTEAVDFTPSNTATHATMVLDCPAPNPRFVASEPKQSEAELGAAAVGGACPDEVRVDCELRMTTDDGGLDETWTVVISAASLDVARLNHRLEPEGFNGSFEIGEPHAANTEVKQLVLDMALSRFGVSGSLASVLESRHDDVASASWVSYARWPAQSCASVGPNAFFVDENSDAGQASAEAIVERLAPAMERSIDWGTGDPSALSLALTPAATGCVAFDPYAEGLSAYYSASLAASTADARLDVVAEGELRAQFDSEEALTYASIEVRVSPTSEQVAALMASSVEAAELLADDYDELELSVRQSFDAGVSAGYVRLLGASIPDCISNPPEPMQSDSGGGVPPCPGIDQQVVFEGTWMP